MAEKLKTRETELKKKTSLIPIIFLAVTLAAVLAYFLIWPQYEKLSAAKNKLEEQKIFLAGRKDELENIKKLISNYEAINQESRDKLAAMLPEKTDEPGLFALFEVLALKNQMALLAIDISEKEPPAEFKNLGIKEVYIAANFSGGEYANMKSLIKDLELNIRLMDILAVNYTPDPSSAMLNIKTYSLDNPPAKR